VNNFEKAIKEIRDIRILDEKKEKENEMDKWFKGLSIIQRVDLAYNFWKNASYKEKEEKYEAR